VAQAVRVSESIKVEGLQSLQRAWKVADAALDIELRETLISVAQPVGHTATALAISEIKKMTLPWSEMRIGVTLHDVYVAPVQRGTRDPRKKRPKFAVLMLDRAMVPALDQNRPLIVLGLEQMLANIGQKWEKVP